MCCARPCTAGNSAPNTAPVGLTSCVNRAGARLWSRSSQPCAWTTPCGASASWGPSCATRDMPSPTVRWGASWPCWCAAARVDPVLVFRRRSQAARRTKRPQARRLRGALQASAPGQAVQIDTLSISLLLGKTVKHFTALDRQSRWCAAMGASNASSASAARFLDKLLASAPFPLRAVQVDGGSEFQGAFEDAARQRNVDLWVLPPSSPQLNGRVERRLATWRYEFLPVLRQPAAPPHCRSQSLHRRLRLQVQPPQTPRRPCFPLPHPVPCLSEPTSTPSPVSHVLSQHTGLRSQP